MFYNKYNGKPLPLSFVVVCIALFLILLFMRGCISTSLYNNGICSKCGGTYVLKEAVGHSGFTNYIYTCDKCGHLIEVGQYFEKENNNEKI